MFSLPLQYTDINVHGRGLILGMDLMVASDVIETLCGEVGVMFFCVVREFQYILKKA